MANWLRDADLFSFWVDGGARFPVEQIMNIDGEGVAMPVSHIPKMSVSIECESSFAQDSSRSSAIDVPKELHQFASSLPSRISIEQLRNRIRVIERSSPVSAGLSLQRSHQTDVQLAEEKARPEAGATQRSAVVPAETDLCKTVADDATAWTVGAAIFDDVIGRHGLDTAAVHEIKPVSANADWVPAWAAARSFALALAVRRLMSCAPTERMSDVLWCTSRAMTAEHGGLYGPGLAALGLDPSRLIVVETDRQQDALWAIEQGLNSHSLALVVAMVDEIELTPARRLALAAGRSQAPCLLLTHPRSSEAAATATRWRIGPAPSAPHPFDGDAPGAPRFTVMLERCRGRPPSARFEPVLLEWCDAAYRFRMAATVADRADGEGRSVAEQRAARGR